MADVLALLSQLIRVDTHNPGGDELAICELLAEALKRRNPDICHVVQVARPVRPERAGLSMEMPVAGEDSQLGAYVYARWGKPKLVLNAHVDTVPPNAGWSGDPYTPRVTPDSHVVGLGAADTKGAIAAILAALDDGTPRDIAVLFSGDEEHGGTCLRAFLEQGLAAGLERAIVCEPTSCCVGTRHRGVMAFDVRLAGQGGHSSRADDLPAPLADLARVAAAWDDWGRRWRGVGPPGFPGMCLNIARLDGGVAFNVVPDSATLQASLRPPPGVDTVAIKTELIELARSIAPSALIMTSLDNPPFATRDLAAYAPLLGEQAVSYPIDMAFWTEAAVLSQAGIDAVVFGPGNISQAHAPDERVPVADLEHARSAFGQVLRACANGAGGS